MRSRRTNTAEPSQRQLRVGEQLKHIISETMRRGHFRNEVLLNAGLITVTEVRVSPDLRNATAYVLTLGGQNMDQIIPALNDEGRVFQKEIGQQIKTKFTPRVRFVIDHSFEEAQKIEDLLRSVPRSSDSDDQ